MPSSLSRHRRIAKARRLARLNRKSVTRAEFNRIIDILNERKKIFDELADAVAALGHDSEIQFKRIAQIQADLDEVKAAWQKMTIV